MSRQERLELFTVAKANRIKMKDIAFECDLSASLLSRFFNNQINMSNDNVKRVVSCIDRMKRET
jgi:hypothetical protein